jgi:hypothetical protein
MFDLSQIEFGKNFSWFLGVVEDRMDPNFLGRVRVRCFGFHTEDRNMLPTEDLPWAMVMQSINSAAQTEVGESPTGLVDGSWVVGFFLDGGEAQQPLVLGSLGGYATKPKNLGFEDSLDWENTGFKDVRHEENLTNRAYPRPPIQVRKKEDKFGRGLGAEIMEESYIEKYPRTEEQNNTTTMRVARGAVDERNFLSEEESINTSIGLTNHLPKEPLGSKMMNQNRNIETADDQFFYDQPNSPYQAIYPFNHVKQTESGHILEFDDTPGAERIHEYHRSGTFREIHPSGKTVMQYMDEKYDLTESHSYEYVKGDKYETLKRGYYQLINSSSLGGDSIVRVAGSSNYFITVDNGDLRLLAPAGKVEFAARAIESRADENLRTGNNLYDSGGNHRIRMKNDISLESQGIISMKTGAHTSTSNMNYSITAGDNLSLHAYHTASLTVENTFAMFPLYIPEPIAIHQVARVGNIVVNAQDGDTKLTSKFLGSPIDIASVTVTSALPTSITSLAQPQPSPEMETHASHPASIVAQTLTGYIYLLSTLGNIVLETQTFNDIKLKTMPFGKIVQTGGSVQISSTLRDIEVTSTLDTRITAGTNLFTRSTLSTNITSGGNVFVNSELSTNVKAKSGITLHTDFGGVRVGDFAATEPAIKGRAFMEVFYRHKHLTPMGPTGPVDTITDPTIQIDLMNSFCKKTFVF